MGLTVSDDYTGGSSGSTTTTVSNVSSTNVALPDLPSFPTRRSSDLGTFHDPGTLDTHTIVIGWNSGGNVGGPGEGLTTITKAGPKPAGTTLTYQASGNWAFTATHRYVDDNPTNTAADVYTIGATVTD